MNFAGTKTIDDIAYMVWIDMHDKDNAKRKTGYTLDFKTTDEVYIVAHAICVLSKSMDGKPHSNVERAHPQLLKEIKALKEKLYQNGLIDEARVAMSIIYSTVDQGDTLSAHKQAKRIASFTESELIQVGTNRTKAKAISSFVKEAMISISKDKNKYEENINTLLNTFTF